MSFSRFQPVLALLAGVSLLTGCVVQSTPSAKVEPLLNAPVLDARLAQEDFGFPAQPPSLMRGKQLFQTHCASCHAAQSWQQPKVVNDLAYTTPIDYYLFLTTGHAPKVQHTNNERREVFPANHPAFKDKLNRDDRWATLFYTRYLAGAGDIRYQSLEGKPLDVAAIYGGNCAVCHGKRGYADGPLHTGRASSHELASAKTFSGLFQPPPANFHDYKRLYNRTDAQMFKYIVEGVYPSGMPAWYGRVDKDYKFKFDDSLIWMLVRHERTFAYNNDLPETEKAPQVALPIRYTALPKGETSSHVKQSSDNYREMHSIDRGHPAETPHS